MGKRTIIRVSSNFLAGEEAENSGFLEVMDGWGERVLNSFHHQEIIVLCDEEEEVGIIEAMEVNEEENEEPQEVFGSEEVENIEGGRVLDEVNRYFRDFFFKVKYIEILPEQMKK